MVGRSEKPSVFREYQHGAEEYIPPTGNDHHFPVHNDLYTYHLAVLIFYGGQSRAYAYRDLSIRSNSHQLGGRPLQYFQPGAHTYHYPVQGTIAE